MDKEKLISELKKRNTSISEVARIRLNITRDEYAFLAYVQYRQADARQKVRGMCCDSKSDIAAFIGVSRPGIYGFIDRMIERGLVEAQAGTGFLFVTPLYTDTDAECKETYQEGVKKVNSACKETLHNGVKKLTHNKEYEKSKSEVRTELDKIFPDAEKAPDRHSPKEPEDQPKKIPWTKTIAALFDQVNEEESAALGVEFTNFNWGAGAARQFKALKDTRKAMIPDIRKKMQHEPTEEDIHSGFNYLFRFGFRYLASIAENKGNGGVQFTPAIILNNYNQILQYAKQNHSPSSKQDRNNAKRDAAYEELFRMGIEMDMR